MSTPTTPRNVVVLRPKSVPTPAPQAEPDVPDHDALTTPAPLDPMQTPTPRKRPTSGSTPRRQCKATTRGGKRCGNAPIEGGTVCRMHGGAAPQVKRRAALRLLELVDPAVATLAREMTTADKSADRQRAANSILDRAGVVRREAPRKEDVWDLIYERLERLRAESEDR